jgi:hypothetical protein
MFLASRFKFATHRAPLRRESPVGDYGATGAESAAGGVWHETRTYGHAHCEANADDQGGAINKSLSEKSHCSVPCPQKGEPPGQIGSDRNELRVFPEDVE